MSINNMLFRLDFKGNLDAFFKIIRDVKGIFFCLENPVYFTLKTQSILHRKWCLFYIETSVYFTMKIAYFLPWKIRLFHLKNSFYFTLKTLYILQSNTNVNMPILPWKPPSISPYKLCQFYLEKSVCFILKVPSISPWKTHSIIHWIHYFKLKMLSILPWNSFYFRLKTLSIWPRKLCVFLHLKLRLFYLKKSVYLPWKICPFYLDITLK